ncbi:serine kinase [Pseudohoeflea coraliihabitans]|uniref:Serine kinase n=1 Tax=Pseudohoeflea coraliihabitans TaxID=2860393 RepID=A0ABS6WLI8_9HYPH|nr:serine kinase [Pseudohoeflea sp. DP4N28-3]MBW3096818.1 serine kinase [Pseudohoeflea sp. DP4N28-3]
MASRPADVTVSSPTEAPIRPETVSHYATDVIETVHGLRDRFPLTCRIQLPGLDIAVHLQDGVLARAINENLVAARARESRTTHLEIFIAHPGIEGVMPPAAWNDELPYLPHAIGMRLERDGLRASYFHDLDHWHLLNMRSGIGVELMRGPKAYPPWEAGAPLRPFLHWHYAATGRRLAHCGTLGHHGTGVLFAGAGGAGKSGTVVAGLLNGLESAGDDYVLLDADDGGTVTASPIFSVLKQDQAGYGRLGLADRLPSPGALNWQGKYEFHISDLCAAGPAEKLRIKALLVPKISHEKRSWIEPVSRRAAMLALAPSAIHQMPGERESGFRFFSRITQALPCHVLHVGTEPREVADTVAAFLETQA